MPRLPRLAAIAVLCTGVLGSVQAYEEQNPTPTGNPLSKVDCSGDNCAAVGGAGAVITSPDRGVNWDYKPVLAIRDETFPTMVFFSKNNPLEAWAVGPKGILYTADAGGTWVSWDISGIDRDFVASFTTGQDNMVIVGSNGRGFKVKRNSSAQKSLADTLPPEVTTISTGTTEWLSDVFMHSDSEYVVVGEGSTVRWTTDDGASWETPTSGVPTRRSLYSVWFADSMVGWIGGDGGLMLRTDDGGDTWTEQTTNTFSDFYDIRFNGRDTGWAVGGSAMMSLPGTVLYTTDGGTTWAEQTANTNNTLQSLYMYDGQSAIAVGLGGTVIRTTDGGTTWEPLSGNNDGELMGISFVDSLTGWAVGSDGTILFTADGGQNWGAAATPYTTDFSGVSFADDQHGWAVGQGGFTIATQNGGTDWASQDATVYVTLNDVCAASATHVWAVGINGIIVHTGNGGTDWAQQTSTVSAALNAVSFCDTSNGWAVGASGTIVSTDDGGTTWNEVTNASTSANLFGVTCVSPDTVWISGFGEVLVTTDGGASWTSGNGLGFGNYTDVAALGSQAWATSWWGMMFYTNDCGQNWTAQSVPTSNNLNAVEVVDADHIWIAGQYGTILLTQADAQTWVQRGDLSYASGTHTEPGVRYIDNSGVLTVQPLEDGPGLAVVVDALGKVVGRFRVASQTSTVWSVPAHESGLLLLRIQKADGTVTSSRLIAH